MDIPFALRNVRQVTDYYSNQAGRQRVFGRAFFKNKAERPEDFFSPD
jgi:hypothetical protein